ncbi:MAG: methyltransferase domain-containing protein [Polyangiales bacterium]|nr:methyltransferase domain-containing protein [Myxococcales bacterium]
MSELRRDCPACGGALEPSFERDGFPFGKCTACGSISVRRVPADADLAAYYNDEAAPDYRVKYRATEHAQTRTWKGRLELIAELRGTERPGTVLDVGASYGAFLRVAADAGWNAYGVEITREGRDAIQSLAGDGHAFERVDELPAGLHFDVITLWDVVEHLPEPVQTLATLRERLAPGGVLFFSTVSIESVNQRLFGRHWHYYRPPRHLVHFTARGIDRMLERAGLERTYRNSRFMAHAFFAGLPGPLGRGARGPAKLAQRALGLGMRTVLDRVGGGDIIDVGAVRR